MHHDLEILLISRDADEYDATRAEEIRAQLDVDFEYVRMAGLPFRASAHQPGWNEYRKARCPWDAWNAWTPRNVTAPWTGKFDFSNLTNSVSTAGAALTIEDMAEAQRQIMQRAAEPYGLPQSLFRGERVTHTWADEDADGRIRSLRGTWTDESADVTPAIIDFVLTEP